MENDVFFKILKKCYDKGLNNAIDITPEFRSVIERDTPGINPVNWHMLPDLLFDELEKLEYIHYITFINHPEPETGCPDNWLDLINVSAMIKPAGILFYNSWNQSKIQDRANRLSSWNIVATFALAVASFSVTIGKIIFDAYKSNQKQSTQIQAPAIKPKEKGEKLLKNK